MNEKSFSKKIVADAKNNIVKMPYESLSEKQKDRLKEDREFFERKIITGMIVDDEFCQWAIEEFHIQNFQTPEFKKIGFWIKEYYENFGNKAPKSDIESVYMEKLQSGAIPDKAQAEFIERILTNLSADYEQESYVNTSYLKKLASREKIRNQACQRAEEILHLGKQNLVEDMLEAFHFEPDYGMEKIHIPTLSELKNEGIDKPELLVKPWLRAGETNILYGDPGTGKSLITLLMTYILGCVNYQNEDCEIGEWQVKKPCGTVYIDGEMGKNEIIERMEQFSWLGEQFPEHEIRVFSLPDQQIKHGKDFDLSKRQNQKIFIKWLKKNPRYKFLVIDSVSTVFGLESENDNSEWNKKINPFLKDLRGLGVAHVIQHHAGKDKKLRGASAMACMAHNIFTVRDHPSKIIGQAWLKIDNSEKQRSAGTLFQPFYIKFFENKEEGKTTWTINPDGGKDRGNDLTKIIIMEILQGTQNKQIAERFKCDKSYVSQIKAKMKKPPYNYLDRDNRVTESGRKFLFEMDEEND